jgi:hypothetical protein
MNCKGLIVAINYKGSNAELKGCINDGKNFKHLLMNHYGFQDENICVLTDDTSVKPTKKNIIAKMQW